MDLKTYISLERGRAAALAGRLGVSPSYVSQMANGQAPISPERCVDIWRETGGMVTREHLRPDDWQRIWPELVHESSAGSNSVNQHHGGNVPEMPSTVALKRRASDNDVSD